MVATKLCGDDATTTRVAGTTGANASVEVAKRQIAERMAMMLFMAIHDMDDLMQWHRRVVCCLVLVWCTVIRHRRL